MDDDSTPSVNSALSVKVVILGYIAVGKTSLLNRYINNVFSVDTPSTQGASYSCKIFNIIEYNQNVKFDVWDTSGQEKYRSLNRLFYKDAKIGILVYDITSRESFDEMTSYWYNQIKEESPKDMILGIAANKVDLYENEIITEEEGREFADSIGAYFKYTSAKLNSGIEDLFKELGRRFLESIPNIKSLKKNIKNDNDSDKIIKITDKPKKKKKKCC